MNISPTAVLPAHIEAALADFADATALVALDFDGTLAPLVADRDAAVMRPATSVLFAAVCMRYPTVVISGRARDDVRLRLGLARPFGIIGNHGVESDSGATGGERAPHAESSTRTASELMAEARTLLAPHLSEDFELEDKGFSLSLHVRERSRPDVVALRTAQVTAALAPIGHHLRIHGGHAVVNVVASSAPDKGTALAELVTTHGFERVLFVGDDVTDEDVFRLQAPWLTGVRIGTAVETAAAYLLPKQHDIDALLAWLVRSRPAPRVLRRTA